MKAFYSDHFVLPLPAGHRFPMAKYAWLRQRVSARIPGLQVIEAPEADDSQLMLAHTAEWVSRVRDGQLDAAMQRAIGFPWSLAMVERSRRSVGATVAALQAALQDGAAVNLAGGTHHAHANAGSGFCVFNDIVVAARVQQQRSEAVGARFNVLVIDLDVHQGDGTASITAGDPSIFTFSMQGRDNFPFERQTSDLDIELPTGCDDATYLSHLQTGLNEVGRRFVADAVIYVAGVDIHQNDRLGKLAVTADAVGQRDRWVLKWCLDRHLPVAMCMAGGYGRDLSAMVDIQTQTVSLLDEFARQWHAVDRFHPPT